MIKHLTKADINKYLSDSSKKKEGDLHRAYTLALDLEKWKIQADELERAAEEGVEEEDELDDEKPSKKRKSNSGKSSTKKPGSSSGKKTETKKADAAGKKRKADGASAASTSGKDADDDGSELDPGSKKVKGWRHELQRNFLGKDGVIKDVSLKFMLSRLIARLTRALHRLSANLQKCLPFWRSTTR